MNGEFPENDALWRLLGRSTAVEPSPCFARNVARASRSSTSAPLFSLPRWIPAAAFASLAAAFALSLLESPTPSTEICSQGTGDDHAGIDLLVTVEEPSLLSLALE